jgi:hypothetical protein
MKCLILFFLLNAHSTLAQASGKQELSFFDTKKAILQEMKKRVATDPDNKKLKENLRCIESAIDRSDLESCKLKLQSGR